MRKTSSLFYLSPLLSFFKNPSKSFLVFKNNGNLRVLFAKEKLLGFLALAVVS